MQEAQALIRAKRFDEARTILIEIDQPLAQQWLDKVNQISPPKQAPKASKSPLPPNWEPSRAPWNPSGIYGFSIITCAVIIMGNLRRNSGFDLMGNVTMTLIFVATAVMVCLALGSMVLAYNWRRLGQPQWFGDTALISVFLLVILVLLGVGAFYTADHNMVLPFAITFVGLLAWIGLTFSFGNGLAMAQLGAYNKWQAYQSGKVLLKHQYNFSGAKTNGIMLTLALAAVGAGSRRRWVIFHGISDARIRNHRLTFLSPTALSANGLRIVHR